MATYECSICGMSVNATCGKCNEPLVDDILKNEEKRNRTQFYHFRKALGDTRGWGAPFHIIIKNGDQNNVGIIMGEIDEKQIMCFLKEAL